VEKWRVKYRVRRFISALGRGSLQRLGRVVREEVEEVEVEVEVYEESGRGEISNLQS